jgi:hypothetical protein
VSADPKQWRLELIVQKGSNGAGLPQILVRHDGVTSRFGWRDRAYSPWQERAGRACESPCECVREEDKDVGMVWTDRRVALPSGLGWLLIPHHQHPGGKATVFRIKPVGNSPGRDPGVPGCRSLQSCRGYRVIDCTVLSRTSLVQLRSAGLEMACGGEDAI